VINGSAFSSSLQVHSTGPAGDLTLLCQMIAGDFTSAATFLTQVLPSGDDGPHFLIWFWDWFERYLTEKGVSFEQIREAKAARLGVTVAA